MGHPSEVSIGLELNSLEMQKRSRLQIATGVLSARVYIWCQGGGRGRGADPGKRGPRKGPAAPGHQGVREKRKRQQNTLKRSRIEAGGKQDSVVPFVFEHLTLKTAEGC